MGMRVIIGISNGLSFSLSILFFSTRTKSSINAVKISGMAQSVGYLIAAFGPPLFGKLHDWDTSEQFILFVKLYGNTDAVFWIESSEK